MATNNEHQPIPQSRVVGLVALGLLAVGLRQLLVASQNFSSDQTRVIDVAVAGIAVALAIAIVGSKGLAVVVAVVGGATGLVAVFQLFAPVTPEVQAAGPCNGARLARADFLATTSPIGVNAREGPGRSFRPALRFGGDCTLSFVGYCLGEPALDEFILDRFRVYDTRWLALPKGQGFISAGVVRAQRPETILPQLENCPAGTPSPQGPVLERVDSPATGDVELTAEASNAYTVGFAAFSEPGEDGRPNLRRIALDALPDPGFTAMWSTSDQTTAGGGHGTGQVLLVAVICAAAEVPTDLVADQVLTLANPDGIPGANGIEARNYESLKAADPALAERLRRTACLLPDPTPLSDAESDGEPSEDGESSS